MSITKIDGKRLRQVAGAFPTGVTVVTTEKEDGSIHGMTASSFLSVSLDPALVSFCVKENATICLLYTSPSPRDRQKSRMPSSA